MTCKLSKSLCYSLKSIYIFLVLILNFLRKLIKVFLDTINEEEGTAYELADIYFKFERETITNDTDNAQIKLTKAQAEQTEVNTLLNIANAGVLDDETILKNICDVLDVDYEEIKDKVPKDDIDDSINALGMEDIVE